MPAGVSSHWPFSRKRMSMPPYRVANSAYFREKPFLGTMHTGSPLSSVTHITSSPMRGYSFLSIYASSFPLRKYTVSGFTVCAAAMMRSFVTCSSAAASSSGVSSTPEAICPR